MNFNDILNEMVLNEYSQRVIQQLTAKFKTEEPSLEDNIINTYIDRFTKIKDKPEVTEKDINKYSWKDLETIVDANPIKRIKAGKLDPTAEDANLFYRQDGVRAYKGISKKACIKYGNGYSFCISSRGEESMYHHYRIYQGGTPFFVFNDNLPNTDPNHVLVIFVYPMDGDKASKQVYYTVTNADNNGDIKYNNLNILILDYPWVKPIAKELVRLPLTYVEQEEIEIKKKYRQQLKPQFQYYDGFFDEKEIIGKVSSPEEYENIFNKKQNALLLYVNLNELRDYVRNKLSIDYGKLYAKDVSQLSLLLVHLANSMQDIGEQAGGDDTEDLSLKYDSTIGSYIEKILTKPDEPIQKAVIENFKNEIEEEMWFFERKIGSKASEKIINLTIKILLKFTKVKNIRHLVILYNNRPKGNSKAMEFLDNIKIINDKMNKELNRLHLTNNS